MATELQEVVGFITNPNPQVRLLALENLVPYSTAEPSIFKADGFQPIKNLKLLIKDHPKVAHHVITILVNLSGDKDVLELLATDEKFLDLVFEYLVNQEEPNANLLAMLLANLTKWDGLKSVIDRRQKAPEALGSDDSVLNQLMDLFVKGQDGGYNKAADFDHLAYAFADLAKHAEVRQYLLRAQSYDGVVPLSKLLVFTEHASGVRRKGVASTIKNAAFEVPAHPDLLDGDGVNILPYVLLPIMGSEEYDVDETMDMLPDLQLLPPDKKRDDDPAIIQTHLETLMLLTTSREGRELMRRVKVYPIVRETHARVSDEAVKEACDRLVQVIMRDEEELDEANRVQEIEDDDDQIVEV